MLLPKHTREKSESLLDYISSIFSIALGEENEDVDDAILKTAFETIVKRVHPMFRVSSFDSEKMVAVASIGIFTVSPYAKHLGNDEYEVCSEILTP